MSKLEKLKALHEESKELSNKLSIKNIEIRELNSQIYSDATGIEAGDIVLSEQEEEYKISRIVGSSGFGAFKDPYFIAQLFAHKKTKTGWHKNETRLCEVPTLVSKGGTK